MHDDVAATTPEPSPSVSICDLTLDRQTIVVAISAVLAPEHLSGLLIAAELPVQPGHRDFSGDSAILFVEGTAMTHGDIDRRDRHMRDASVIVHPILIGNVFGAAQDVDNGPCRRSNCVLSMAMPAIGLPWLKMPVYIRTDVLMRSSGEVTSACKPPQLNPDAATWSVASRLWSGLPSRAFSANAQSRASSSASAGVLALNPPSRFPLSLIHI